MEAVQTFCRRHDRHWLVLDHIGKPLLRDTQRDPSIWRTQLQALALAPHVLCKLSGLVTETSAAQRNTPVWPDAHAPLLWACFDAALEAFGPKRLMFGSDWPVCQLAAPYAQVHGVVQAWAESRLSTSEQADFWHKNAECCYALEQSHTTVHQH
jgi:L-fuconolactonase